MFNVPNTDASLQFNSEVIVQNPMFSKIEIGFKDGTSTVWEETEWDDYTYDGKMFIIKNQGAWVGLYNIDVIRSVVVK